MKHLKVIQSVIILGLSLFFSWEAMGATVFEVTSPRTKIGEGTTRATRGGGRHIVIDGSTIYAAYINTNINNEQEVSVGTSLDGGLTWEKNEIIAHASGIDTHGAVIAIGPDGLGGKILHVAWGQTDPVTGITSILYSRRLAGSWSAPQNVSGSLQVIGWEKSIAADGVGGVHISFTVSVPPTGTLVVYYSSSNNYGQAFNEINTLIDSNVTGNARTPSIAADNFGNVFLVWYYNETITNVMKFRKKTSGVWNSTVIVESQNGDIEPSIAVYDANNIYFSHATTVGVNVAITSDGGSTWQIRNVTIKGLRTSIAVDASKVISLASGDYGLEFSRSNNNGNTWTPSDVIDPVASYPSIAVDSLGKAHIIYTRNNVVYFTKER